MFSNVIAGVDGRDGGRAAAALAKTLCDGRLTLVAAYAFEAAYSPGSMAGFAVLQNEETPQLLEESLRELGLDADVMAIADGSPARALHRTAEERGADLIVVGSAHHGALGRILLGDVGRVVLHDAPCAVAVAPNGFSDGPPRRIAVGFDGSEEAQAALSVAQGLAAQHGAALTVYVVWGVPSMSIAVAAGDAANLERTVADARRGAEELLADTLAKLPNTTAGHAVRGAPRTELEKVAADVDLLVVGSRGWGSLKRVALGSTSDWLAHHAVCPVLVVPRRVTVAASPDPATAATAKAPA